MVLGLLWYGATTAAAFVLLVARFGTHLTLAEHVAISFPVGAVVPAWVVYAVACLTSALGPHTLIGSTGILCYLLYENLGRFTAALPRVLKSATSSPSERIDTAIAAGIVAVASLFLVPLYSTRMIPEQDGKIWSGGSCWADLPIHMTIAESFLSGRNQDVSWGGMHSPVFAGEKLAYPFMPDFHAAIMVKLGGTSMRQAFLWPGLCLALSLLALLFLLTVRVTRSRLGGVLAILLLLGAGGMGGWNLAARDGFWAAAVKDTAQNDAVGSDGRIVWFAFLPHVLLPQRGANFAYPLNLAVLLLVWRAGDMCDKAITYETRKTMLLVAGGLAGLLPLVQAHSFIALGCIIAVVAALDFHKWLADPRLLVAWAQAGVLAVVEAYPQMRMFQHQVESGASGHFIKFGMWYKNHEVGQPAGWRGFMNFWWMNTGPALSLFLLCCLIYTVETFYALIYAEVVRAYGLPSSLGPSGTGSASAAAGAPSSILRLADPLDELYLKEQPAPTWASVTNKNAARAAAAAAGVPYLEASASAGYSSAVRRAGGRGRRDSDGSDGGEWTVERNEDEGEGGEEEEHGARGGKHGRQPTTPEMLAMAAAGSGFGRAGAGGGPTSLELRIAHLEMEYTLPGVASTSPHDPPRFKLELPQGSKHAAPTVIVSHVGGGQPDMGLAHASLAAMSAGSGSGGANAGAGAHPGSGAGSPPATAGAGAASPPPGARVARAFDPAALKDGKKAPHFAAHVWGYAKAQAAAALGVHVDDLFDPSRYAVSAVDRALWTANRLSPSGRVWDTLKLALGSALVFLVGNYVNFQPWDRDNCKLFYVWIMMNAMLAGSLLAAPVEFLLGIGPGATRIASWLPVDGLASYGRALFISQGTAALPTALYPPDHRLVVPGAAGAGAAADPAGKHNKGERPSAALAASGSGGRRVSTPAGMAALASAAPRQMFTARAVAAVLLLAAPWLLLKATLTGFMMVYREYGLYHVLLDEEQVATGAWIRDNLAPKAVLVHKDTHITPGSCLAGRPSLVSYTGWMWSHGYNYGERDRDRNYIMENALKDSDGHAYNLMRRWGIRYVMGESLPRHARNEGAPGFNQDLYLDNQLKRVYSNGRFDIMEVLGYGFPPN